MASPDDDHVVVLGHGNLLEVLLGLCYRPSWYRRAYPFDAVGRKKMQDLFVEAGSVPSVPISDSSGW